MGKIKYIIATIIATVLTTHVTAKETNNYEAKEINNYAGKIKESIESKMENTEKYKGKKCTIRIKMNENGNIMYIKEEGGDKELCKSAITAVRKARLPPPPSKEVYEVFKNAPLDFKP